MSEETKPQTDPEFINVRVKSAEGAEVFFKIKRTTVLKKLMGAFCSRQGLQADAVRFMYDGQRLEQDKTPNDYDMEDQDVIDVMTSQTGGSC